MAARVEAMSETDPRIFAARRQRVATDLSSPENSKIKLDPRITKILAAAALVALGVITLALPTIDSAASVDVSAHPLYSPAPAAISAEPGLTIARCPSPTGKTGPVAAQTVETTRTKAEPTKSVATPTETAEPEPPNIDYDYACSWNLYVSATACSGEILSTDSDCYLYDPGATGCVVRGSHMANFTCTWCSAGCDAGSCNPEPTNTPLLR